MGRKISDLPCSFTDKRGRGRPRKKAEDVTSEVEIDVDEEIPRYKKFKSSDDTSISPSIATKADLQDVLKELPADLVQNLPTIISRLNSFITFYSAINLKRLARLSNFVIRAEDVLFDEDNILNMDTETLQDFYKQAKTASLEILDLARKVAIQIPQEEANNKDVDEVYKLLKSLSPESLSAIKDSLLGAKDHEDEDNDD